VTDQNAEARCGYPLQIPHLSVLSPPEKFLTIWIIRVQPRCLQCLSAFVQKEPRAPHLEQIHGTKSESPKIGDHIPYEALPCKARERQSSPQWGDGERDERCVGRTPLSICGETIVELEVLEVREESDEIQDLSARACGLSEGEESKGWREVSEALLNVWHESR